jgi:hypothetical protein
MREPTSRTRQLRLERKRRRRVERKSREQRLTGGEPSERKAIEGEVGWRQTLVLAPEGREASPRQLARLSAFGMMSDALLKLTEPYCGWPPSPEEIPALRAWLELGAKVWNAVVRSDVAPKPAVGLDAALESIPGEWELLDEEEPLVVKKELADRKRRLFADDYRMVSHVRVWEEGKMAMVEAGTLTYLR